VANEQRRNIYEFRNQLLEVELEPMKAEVEQIIEDVMNEEVARYIPVNAVVENWDVEGLENGLLTDFDLKAPVSQWIKDNAQISEDDVCDKVTELAVKTYNDKVSVIDDANILNLERSIMLQLLDRFWKEHLASMDCLRQGIYLRGYAQKNPKNEYKTESSKMFGVMLSRYKTQVVNILLRIQIRTPEEIAAIEAERQRQAELESQSATTNKEETQEEKKQDKAVPFTRNGQKVGRNDPCPCGSGKKFKNCCGKL
jgi:preprotein translocase subunit SecA